MRFKMARFIGVDLASAWCEAETRRLDSTGIRMWATRVLRMAVRKTSTGIVGLPVNPNARQDLIAIYQKTLREVQALPDGIAYRNAVEQITSYRLKVVQENEDEDVIEKTINCGQLEELIEQAEDELSIFPVYLEHKLWEPPVKSA